MSMINKFNAFNACILYRKLNDMFGVCARPHLGWQLDTFGHSSETASMMAQMGFDALFFARLDTCDKNRRLSDQDMEFIWKPSSNLGKITCFCIVVILFLKI